MKKILFIALAIITFNVSAQENKREGKERMHAYKDLSAAEMATLKTKKMTLHLDLSEKQQKEIYAINLKNAEDRKAFMEKRQARKESGNLEKPSKEDRLKMMNARLDHQIAMKDKMKSILNDEQFTKWEKAQAKMAAKKHDGMKKGHHMKKKIE